MAYKIQQLTEEGYDFNTLFPEKQESVKESTGLDFDLGSIVKFLQKQTNNFTIDNQIAHDLDDAIFSLVKKAGVPEPKPEPMPQPEPAAPPLEEESDVKNAIIDEFQSVIDTFDFYSKEEKQSLISDFEIEMDGLELLDDDEDAQIRFKLLRDMLIPKLKELSESSES